MGFVQSPTPFEIDDARDGEDSERLRAATTLAERAPRPARVANVSMGTAGWTDPSLITSGRFDPAGVKSAEDRRRFYARHFSLVAVDATDYVLPSVDLVRRWCSLEPTPESAANSTWTCGRVRLHPLQRASERVAVVHPILVGR